MTIDTRCREFLYYNAQPRKRQNSQRAFEGLDMEIDESHNCVNTVARHESISTQGARMAEAAELPDVPV